MNQTRSSFFIIICAIITLAVICVVSCSSPDPGDEVPVEVAAPENVSASRDGDSIIITWDAAENAVKYIMYRKEGQGAFEPIPGGMSEMTEFTDVSFPTDLIIQYSVASEGGDGTRSVLSAPSNTLSNLVQLINATAYERQDGIQLEWALHPETPDNYKIYRYRAINMSAEAVFSVNTNTYLDLYTDIDGPEKDIPYFYQVTWEKTGVEYGTTVSHVFGIFGDVIDYGEPNNDLPEAKHLTIGGPAVAAKLFSFSDGNDGVAADTDWYTYHGQTDYEIIATINIPVDTPFTGNEFRFSWFYNGTYYGENILNPGKNTLTFHDFGGAAGDIDLYAKIYPVVDSTSSKNGSYSISISDEFTKK